MRRLAARGLLRRAELKRGLIIQPRDTWPRFDGAATQVQAPGLLRGTIFGGVLGGVCGALGNLGQQVAVVCALSFAAPQLWLCGLLRAALLTAPDSVPALQQETKTHLQIAAGPRNAVPAMLASPVATRHAAHTLPLSRSSPCTVALSLHLHTSPPCPLRAPAAC